MSEKKTYPGGCHCGQVRFEADIDLATVYACNCSMCSKMGWRLSFVPESDFRLLQGQEALADYQFNKKHIHNYFAGIAACGPLATVTTARASTCTPSTCAV